MPRDLEAEKQRVIKWLMEMREFIRTDNDAAALKLATKLVDEVAKQLTERG